MSKTIRQSVTFKATPHQVYEALMDSRKHGSSQAMPPTSAARRATR